VAGSRIDESDEQSSNAELSIHESLESDSNVIVERESHPQKQSSQIVSTEEGIQIDDSDEQHTNAQRSRRESLESDLNVTVERE
jgi:hypothetical protein